MTIDVGDTLTEAKGAPPAWAGKRGMPSFLTKLAGDA
jgi:hypothetical protein